MGRLEEAALYLHVPFCRSKCPYCDFYSEPGGVTAELSRRYLEAVKAEVSRRKEEVSGYLFVTFYAGGGTPSLLGPAFYEELLDFLSRELNFSPQELTLEANPEGLTLSLLKEFRRLFDRLSLGAQSLLDEGLLALGRRHTVEEVFRAVDLSREAGFENLSLDLIFAWPGESLSAFARELKILASLSPEHVSCYELTLEPGTRFFRLHQEGRLRLPPEEEVVAMHHLAHEFLGEAGFEHYEISNFARPGFRCRHNLFYWEVRPYLGLGPGAASYLRGVRRKNEEDLAAYLESLAGGGLPPAEEERLGPEERFREAVILGLRLLEGVDLGELERRFGFEPRAYYGKRLLRLLEEGLLVLEGERLSLSERGRLLANVVFRELV